MDNIATCPYIKLQKRVEFEKFFKKDSFSYTQRDNFFRPIGVFASLGVAIFRVTLRDRAQIFLEKTTIYENGMTQFVFIFSTRIKCEERKECDMKKYLLFYVTLVMVQVK